MSENEAAASKAGPGERVAIGITFGNSNSSIAYTIDDKAEVIANEDGGTYRAGCFMFGSGFGTRLTMSTFFLLHRPTNTHDTVLR